MAQLGIPVQLSTGAALKGDANDNALVNLPPPAQAGTAMLAVDNNPDGDRQVGYPYVSSSDRRLSTGQDTVLFDHAFLHTVQNSHLFRYSTSTVVATQGAQALLLNSSLQNAAASGCCVSTWRNFTVNNGGALCIDIWGSLTDTLTANAEIPLGQYLFNSNPGVLPLDGVWFRIDSGGVVGCSLYNVGAIQTVSLLPAGSFVHDTINQIRQFRILVDQHGIEFWIEGNDHILRHYGTLPRAAAQGHALAAYTAPVSVGWRNSGAVSGVVASFKITHITVTQREIDTGWSSLDLAHSRGRSGSRTYEGFAPGNTALHVNNATPTAVVLTNTTAAFTGLGGQFAVTPTLALGTDGILCGYQVPAASVTGASSVISPKTLRVRGGWMQAVVTGALTGGPVAYQYSVAYGHTAVSLVTAEAASFAASTTKAPIRLLLGADTFPAAAGVGTLGTRIPFTCNFLVNPGEFISIILKGLPGSTAFTVGTIHYIVHFETTWE